MPHDSLHQQSATPKAHEPQQEHDVDGGHDPERARKVSTSLLRREAAKSSGPSLGQTAGPKGPVDAGVVTVKESVVDLGSGSPRDQIQEAVIEMAVSWNRMVSNFGGAVEQLVSTVQHAQFRQAEPGFLSAIWTKAEGLLSRAATVVSGTALAGEIGLAAIKKIVAYGDALEQQRTQADQDAFIKGLRAMTKSVQLDGVGDGGNQFIHRTVSKLDAEFVNVGKINAEDAWKQGERGVVGAQATFLKELNKKAEDYTAHVPTQADFAGDFLVEWVNANHKKRKRSAARSPFEDSSYQDGYVGLNLKLHYDAAYSGWFIGAPILETATLHCPRSHEVADALTETISPFSLDELDLPIVVDIQAADSAWHKMPAHWKNERTHRVQLRNGMVTSGAKEYWLWVMDQTHHSTREILASVTKMRG